VSLNLDPFGGTPACHILVEKLNRTDDRLLARDIVVAFNRYFETMGELLKLNNPSRDIMMRMWYEKVNAESKPNFEPRLEAHGIPYSYFHNILTHRLRQQRDHGALLEKFRDEDRDHAEILYALRMMAKYRATGNEEYLVDENQI